MAKTPQQALHLLDAARLTQKKDDLLLFTGLEVEGSHQCGARIEGRLDGAGQFHPAERCRVVHRAVASEEFGTVGSEAARPETDVGKRHGRGEIGIERIPGEERSAFLIQVGNDIHGGLVADGAEHPFGVERGGQLPPPFAQVAHAQAQQLDRIIRGDEQEEFLGQTVAAPLEGRIPLTVPHGHRGAVKGVGSHFPLTAACLPHLSREKTPDPFVGGRPELAGRFVAQVDDLSRRI